METKPSSEYQFLWVLTGPCKGSRAFYKLDTNLQFTKSSSSSPNYIGLTEATRSLAFSSPNYIGRTKPKPTRSPPFSSPSSPFAVVRCSRHSHLRVCSRSKAKTKLKKSPVLPPLLPQPDFVARPGEDLPQLPHYTGIAALGSKIFVIGGSFYLKPIKGHADLPRDVFVYDTRIPGFPPQISSQLNCGKSWPIVCTINGKIYVMPDTFTPPAPSSGRYFECFDPASNLWKVLPNPPFVGRDMDYRNHHWFFDRFRVMSHVVVGSILIISIRADAVYRFDTARPDIGWKRIRIVLSSPRLVLNYLPLTYRSSVSCSFGKGLIVSQVVRDGAGDYVFDFLTRTLKMKQRDLYVCSFDDMNALSDTKSKLVKITVKPVVGLTGENLKWREFAKYAAVSSLSRIEDGVVMYATNGYEDPECEVGLYYGFDLLRIERVLKQQGEYDYKGSSISWACFRAQDPIISKRGDDTLSVLVVDKDGNLSS